MQEASHHGQIIREYREGKVGITQAELASRIGRSRRTVVNIEQTARIGDAELRRALFWALQIPPQLLGLMENPAAVLPSFEPAEQSQERGDRGLGRLVFDTFVDNLRMRLDLYYLGSSLAADRGLNVHIRELERQIEKAGSKGRYQLLTLLCHNYQLKGMIARDQLDYATAEYCFNQSIKLAVEADCVELNALAMGRLAVMYIWQDRLTEASHLYSVARDISKRSVPGLSAFLATGHAEVQGLLKDRSCLSSLTQARSLLSRVDPADDHLLLVHASRCSEKAIGDGWSQCHTLLGMPDIAIESYERLEAIIDPSMTRMRARLYTQYAEALYVGRDMSCCFYAIEGFKLAKAVGSQYNLYRVKKLALKLFDQCPQDNRVQDLLQVVNA